MNYDEWLETVHGTINTDSLWKMTAYRLSLFLCGTGPNRARYYEYALGSARESRDWYHKGRLVLGEMVVAHRFDLIAQIAKLLLTMIPDQRGRALRDGGDDGYDAHTSNPVQAANDATLASLLSTVPMTP